MCSKRCRAPRFIQHTASATATERRTVEQKPIRANNLHLLESADPNPARALSSPARLGRYACATLHEKPPPPTVKRQKIHQSNRRHRSNAGGNVQRHDEHRQPKCLHAVKLCHVTQRGMSGAAHSAAIPPAHALDTYFHQMSIEHCIGAMHTGSYRKTTRDETRHARICKPNTPCNALHVQC